MPPVKLDLISTNAPKALKLKRFSLVNTRGEDNIALCLELDREIGGVSPPLGGIRNGRGRIAPRVTLTDRAFGFSIATLRQLPENENGPRSTTGR